MTKQRTAWQQVIFWGVIAWALLLSSSIYAQEDETPPEETIEQTGITLTARVGFDGLSKGGQGWWPVQVTIANNGPAVTGSLVTRNDSFSSNPTYAVPIDLPTQSNKRVSFSVYHNALPSSPFIITLVDEDNQTIARTVVTNLRALDAQDSMLYGVVSPNPDAVRFLATQTQGRSDAAVAFLNLDDLPADKVAWRHLDLLVLNDVDTNQLTVAQREALAFWVSQGGQLVVTGGASWQKTTTAVADLLPVTVTGSQSVPDLPALAEKAGVPFRDPGPYVIATSNLTDGELLYHQDGLPILARRGLGRGSVFFLAIDPQFAPLESWNGSRTLWKEITSYVPRRPFWEEPFANQDQASNAVEVLPDVTLPSGWLLFGFMLLYIVTIGPINYFVLGRMQRRELGWITIPASILLFSIIAFIIGFQFKGNSPIVNQMSVVSGRAGQTEAYVQSAAGVYSPGRTTYDIELEDDVLIRPLDSFSSGLSSSGLAIIRDGRVRINDAVIDVGGVGTFAVQSVRPLPQILATATLEESGNSLVANIEITNNSNTTLQDATLVFNNTPVALGDLEPGQSQSRSITIPATQRAAFQAITEGAPPNYISHNSDISYSSPLDTSYDEILGTPSYYSGASRGRYDLLESMYDNYGSRLNWEAGGIYLTAWTDEAQLDIQLNSSRYDTAATTLYFLELPLE